MEWYSLCRVSILALLVEMLALRCTATAHSTSQDSRLDQPPPPPSTLPSTAHLLLSVPLVPVRSESAEGALGTSLERHILFEIVQGSRGSIALGNCHGGDIEPELANLAGSRGALGPSD